MKLGVEVKNGQQSSNPELFFFIVRYSRKGVRGLGRSDQKNYSGFELCSLFLTHTPSFIQIGPKLAKLVLWGGLGGWG